LSGHADSPGTAAANVFTFSVPLDDSLAPAGATTIIAFQIAANDLAGHAALLSGDPKEVVQVDRDAPQFSEVVIVTAPDLTVNGRDFYDGGATPLQVNATVTDGGAGVDAASVCLRIAGETGACAHPGTATGGSHYSFSLPRPTAAMDGTVPLDFTLTADDVLAAGLTGASQAEHQGQSAVQHVFFDNQPPAIAVTPDATPYARGGAAISVTATISDPTGVFL